MPRGRAGRGRGPRSRAGRGAAGCGGRRRRRRAWLSVGGGARGSQATGSGPAASGTANRRILEAPGEPWMIRFETPPVYFFASFFLFTYAQIFFVISEGPISAEPITDSSVSLQPLKLIE